MKEQSKLERSLKMLQLLMQPGNHYTVLDLCHVLDIDRRTLYRYITEFNRAGFVIMTDQHYIRMATKSPLSEISDLLYFNQEEAITLYNAIESIETNNELRAGLKQKLVTLYGTKPMQDKLMRLEKSKSVRNLDDAIQRKRRVIIKGYSSPHSNSTKDRYVEPFELSEDRKYLWALEIDTRINKVFKINRMESVEVLDEVWLFSRLHQSGFTDAFHIISMNGTTVPVRLRLDRRAHSLLVEEYPLTEKDITHEDGSDFWIYESEVSSYVGIGRFVMGLLDSIQIETPALKEYIMNYIMQNLYK